MVDLNQNGIQCIHAPKTMDLDLQTYSVGGDSTINRIAQLVEEHVKIAEHLRDGLRAVEMKKQAAKTKDDSIAPHFSAGPTDLIAITSAAMGGPLAGAAVGGSLGYLAHLQRGKALGAGVSGMPPPEPVKGEGFARTRVKQMLRNRYDLDKYIEDNPNKGAVAGAVGGAAYGLHPALGAAVHVLGGRAILKNKKKKKGD